MPGLRINVMLLIGLGLTGCVSGTSQRFSQISEADLKNHALLFGSIWELDESRSGSDVYVGWSADGAEMMRIVGDGETEVEGPEGIGHVRLFTQLVTPGDYRFAVGNDEVMEHADIDVLMAETFTAGQIVYLGQMVCVPLSTGCWWLSFDQLGRDLYYANEAAPAVPWRRVDFRAQDLSSTGLEFRSQQVNLQPPGSAKHIKTGVAFPLEQAGFVRHHVETFGSNAAGAVYEHEGLEARAQVLIYPMNLIGDSVADMGLSDRLREVVLEREAAVSLSAYFRDADTSVDDYKIMSDVATVMWPEGIRAGRQIDAIGEVDGSQRVRFYIFSHGGWLIRYRFTWGEGRRTPNAKVRMTVGADATDVLEAAFRQFLLAQQWPDLGRESAE